MARYTRRVLLFRSEASSIQNNLYRPDPDKVADRTIGESLQEILWLRGNLRSAFQPKASRGDQDAPERQARAYTIFQGGRTI
jgi:hypothetical protein